VLGVVELALQHAQTGFGQATGIAPPQQLVSLRVDEGPGGVTATSDPIPEPARRNPCSL